jgi:DNA-directed RNA polymerase subunit omega
MSVVEPTIDELLSVTDENRFLLCEMAARRARDINDMMRNQHNRAEQLAEIDDISVFLSDDEGHAPNPLSIAFSEIAPKHDEDGTAHVGALSFDERNLNQALGLPVEDEPEAQAEEEVSIDDLVSEIDEALEGQLSDDAEAADEPVEA